MTDASEDSATLGLAIESLRQGNRMVDIALRGPLAEWLEDAAEGDDEGDQPLRRSSCQSPAGAAISFCRLGRQNAPVVIGPWDGCRLARSTTPARAASCRPNTSMISFRRWFSSQDLKNPG